MVAHTLIIGHELESFSISIEARDNDNWTVSEALKFLPKMLGNMANLRGLKLRLLNEEDQDCLINNGYWFTYKRISPKVGHWPQLTYLEIGGLAIGGSELVRLLARKLQRLDLAFVSLLDGL